MPSFAPMEQKTASDARPVTLYRDSTGAWFVGAPVPECSPQPMGAFREREGARRWADRHFPGGAWGPAAGRARLPAGTHLPRLRASQT